MEVIIIVSFEEMGGSYWYEYLASCMPQRPNITVQETQAWSKIPEKNSLL